MRFLQREIDDCADVAEQLELILIGQFAVRLNHLRAKLYPAQIGEAVLESRRGLAMYLLNPLVGGSTRKHRKELVDLADEKLVPSLFEHLAKADQLVKYSLRILIAD